MILKMSIADRKEREKTEMRKLILDAAMELFIKEGYDGLSIRRIANKIEYSPGSIYTYFEDKDSLFYALHVEGFGMLYQKQLAVQNIADPRERLIAHGRAYLEFALENQQYYDIMFIVKGPEEIICKKEDWSQGFCSYDILKKNVIECHAAGMFKDQDLDAVAFSLWANVHGTASLLIRRGFALQTMIGKDLNKLIENGLDFLGQIIK